MISKTAKAIRRLKGFVRYSRRDMPNVRFKETRNRVATKHMADSGWLKYINWAKEKPNHVYFANGSKKSLRTKRVSKRSLRSRKKGR